MLLFDNVNMICDLLNIRAFKRSQLNKIHMFEYMDKIFCVEFQMVHNFEISHK